MLFSCKKEKLVYIPSSSLTIVNAINSDCTVIVPSFNREAKLRFLVADTIRPGNFHEYGGYAGTLPMAMFDRKDTVNAILKQDINVIPESISTLYIAGEPNNPIGLYKQDTIATLNRADSVINVRFVNLCAGLNGASIQISDKPELQFLDNLSFKAVSSFKTLKVDTKQVPSRIIPFTIKERASGNEIGTYDLKMVSSIMDVGYEILNAKSVTIVLAGTSTSLRVMRVNNY
ncbi:hypothetical protein D0C36_18475 [Mucilaginibacter conchicola]|uniref:DUF4397 domain-containing protein n=2 Tax=Mucilaginibacter conchicola TaxID=2303333 RepID=A0A372NPT3_9SPHI|nr:hypothetical protein D0C36_18475 [Mucilaginibacter conchicola]